MTAQPRYDALADLIAAREWWFAASEAHGILSALIACNHGGRWPEILFAQGEVDAIAHEAFDRLSLQIEEALAAWAQGFTVAVHWLHPALDEDARAFLADLEEIGKLDYDLEDNEDNRRQLISLEEHCRMGALLIYAECHQKPERPA